MGTCDEVRAQRIVTLADIATTKIDLAGAIAEAKQNPHDKFLPKEVARLKGELAQLRVRLAALDQQIATQCSGPAQAVLVGARITFTTHEDDLETDSYLSVFVRNQPPDGSVVLRQRDLIGNRLAWERHQEAPLTDRNPFLAAGGPFGVGEGWDEGSTHGPFPLGLPLTPVLRQDVGIPVVDVHLLTDGSDRWMFSWVLNLEFSDGTVVTSRSDTDGVAGVVLDQDNLDHMGLGIEDLGVVRPPRQVPDSGAVLTEVTVAFHTRGDTKEAATGVQVHVVDRRGPTQHRSIATALGLFAGEGLDTGSVHAVAFGAGGLPLDGGPLALRDLVLPLIFIRIDAPDDDRWSFDYEVTFQFSDGRSYRSRATGVVLTRAHPKHAGAWRGDGFPKVRQPGSQTSTGPATAREKRISLDYLRRRLDQFVNSRQDTSPSTSISPHAALRQIRLHNTGEVSGSTLPASYLDVRVLDAEPPAPGTITDASFVEALAWRSNPTSLGQLMAGPGGLGDTFLVDINSRSITVDITPGGPVPLTVTVQFETEGEEEVRGSLIGAMNLDEFSIVLRMSLQAFAGRVELFAWIDELETLHRTAVSNPPFEEFNGTWLGQPLERTILGPLDTAWDLLLLELLDSVVHVSATTSDPTDFGGKLQRTVRQKIYDGLRAPDPFTGRRPRDDLSMAVTSFLLGDVPATEFTRGTTLHDLTVDNGEIVISYVGPQAYQPPMPAGWPASFSRDIGSLGQIDHIVVLTMENRSFDHMLGYLSLPPEAGGAGRTDVDGLRGGEFNTLDDDKAMAFAFTAGDTVFSPDPPHGYEPVALALDAQPDGVASMGGFVRAFATERGRTVAPRIMGHHTAANVPTYDGVARDFGVGHRWFAAHPGPTFCNRFYQLTGHPNLDPDGFFELDNGAAGRPSSVPTIFDHLTAAGVSWRYFEHEYCFLRLFERYTFDDEHVVAFDDPGRGFAQLAALGGLPSVSFIDPHFIELPPGANCDGAPADIRAGQELVRRVVETVVASPHWERTLLVVLYDEHGGFYDHVPPPTAVPVTPDLPAAYGVRVPAFVISPWVAAHSVFGHDATPDGRAALHFDHTSLLATIVRRFLAQNPPAMGARYAVAEDLSSALAPTPRPTTGRLRPFLPYRIASSGGVLGPLTTIAPGGGVALRPDPGPATPGPQDLQAFCLEDRPDGRFRIRSRVGGLYLTAQPDGRVVLDVERPDATAGDSQVWMLQETPAANGPFVVRCAAQPGQALRSGVDPADPSVVGMGPAPANLLHAPSWRITSPLLPPAGNTTHP
jgi:phospholipase C